MLAYLPLLLGIALSPFGDKVGLLHLRELLWTASLCFASFIMCLAANAVWTYVDARSHLVDEILDANDSGKLDAWVTAWYGRWRQWVPPFLCLIASVIFLIAFKSSIQTIVLVPIASFFSVGWTTLIAANCLYWFAIAPAVIRQMAQQGSLKLHWYDPASTPALKMLAKGVLWSGTCLAVGSIGVFGIGFALPNAIKVKAVAVLVLAFASLASLLLVVSSLIPFMHLVAMAGKVKKDTLFILARSIKPLYVYSPLPGAPASSASPHLAPVRISGYNLDDEQSRVIGVYRTVSSASTVPFATGALIQYGAVVAGGVLAPLFGVVNAIVHVATK